MANMKEVARLAGVSNSTVSRVIGGKSVVNEQTRQKVLSAVRQLDYEPNFLAKSLKSGSSQTVALVVPGIDAGPFPLIARGVEDIARRNGFSVILCSTGDNAVMEREYIARNRTRWVDGMIFCTMTEQSEHLRTLKAENFPVVLANRFVDSSFDAVGIDNRRAAYDAVSYLAKTGHRRIALALGAEDSPELLQRRDGYRDAMRDNGFAADAGLILDEGDTLSSFYCLAQEFIGRSGGFDAVFAVSDEKAIAVIRALKDRGLRVPEDVSVLGFGNSEIGSMTDPPLSTVSYPLYEIGSMAMKKLIGIIRRKKIAPPAVDILDTALIIRKSTG